MMMLTTPFTPRGSYDKTRTNRRINLRNTLSRRRNPCRLRRFVRPNRRLIGRDRNARLVGKVLSMAQCYGKYPCHRVVNSAGRTAPGWARQRALLEQEGVQFKPNGCVDMKRYQWEY